MANVLTTWRRALVAHLQENLQDGDWDVRSGERDGHVKDRKLCVVFVPAMVADSGNVQVARPPMLIRAWIKKSKQPNAAEPPDPEPLEQLAVDLLTCLQPVQTSLVSDVYFFATAVEIDYDDWGVQVTLASWTDNPAVLPA